jgi:hypothetical protein
MITLTAIIAKHERDKRRREAESHNWKHMALPPINPLLKVRESPFRYKCEICGWGYMTPLPPHCFNCQASQGLIKRKRGDDGRQAID